MLSLLQNQGESSRLSAVRWGLELGTDEELDKGRRRPTREDNAGLEQEEACRAKGGGWGGGGGMAFLEPRGRAAVGEVPPAEAVALAGGTQPLPSAAHL